MLLWFFVKTIFPRTLNPCAVEERHSVLILCCYIYPKITKYWKFTFHVLPQYFKIWETAWSSQTTNNNSKNPRKKKKCLKRRNVGAFIDFYFSVPTRVIPSRFPLYQCLLEVSNGEGGGHTGLQMLLRYSLKLVENPSPPFFSPLSLFFCLFGLWLFLKENFCCCSCVCVFLCKV